MKKYLLTLLVSLVSVTTFAQEAQQNPLAGSTEVIACYGDEVAIESAIGLDASGAIVNGLLLFIDPATSAVAGGSLIALSSVTADAAAVNAEGVLTDMNALSYVLKTDRAAEDFSYVDEAANTVTVPTYVGTITVSDGTNAEVINVSCIVQSVL